jgi:hypothetical protein
MSYTPEQRAKDSLRLLVVYIILMVAAIVFMKFA